MSYKTQMTAGLCSLGGSSHQLYSSCQYEPTSFLNKSLKQVKPNSNSEKIILKRFNKEFTKYLLEVLDRQGTGKPRQYAEESTKQRKLPMYIQFDVFRSLLDQMVFLKQGREGGESQADGHLAQSS